MKLDDNDPLYSEWSNGVRPSEGNLRTVSSLAPHELHPDEPERHAQTSPEHRARLRRYVMRTVVACVALCLAAIVRVGVSRLSPPSDEAIPPSHASVAAQLAEPRAETSPAAPRPHDDAIPPPPPPTTSPLVPVRASSTALPATGKPALREREVARRALEGGKAKDAIAAAERSTEIDPTDAEAWLILGAAHSELGHLAAARDAFRSCAKSAKRGPVRECAAMLR